MLTNRDMQVICRAGVRGPAWELLGYNICHSLLRKLYSTVSKSATSSADPRLLGALRKNVSLPECVCVCVCVFVFWGGGCLGMKEWMKLICPCFTPSRALPWLGTLVFMMFCMTFTLHDFTDFLCREGEKAPH